MSDAPRPPEPHVPRFLRRAVVTAPVTERDAAATATGRFLLERGVSVDTVDTSTEDPFLDVDHLVPEIDLRGADAVITLGSPSVTAFAISLLHDVPFTMVGALDGSGLRAIEAALESGSVMHRSVLDVRVDGVRRLCLSDLEVDASEVIEATASDGPDRRRVAGTHLRVGAERPHSGCLCIEHPDGPPFSAELLHVSDAPAGARVAINGRDQQFRDLSVAVHGQLLRELVLAPGRDHDPA